MKVKLCHVLTIACAAATLAGLLGLWFPWGVVLVAEVLVACVSTASTWTVHQRELRPLMAVERASTATDKLFLWEVQPHEDEDILHFSLAWAHGKPLLAWKDATHYEPDPDEVGPQSYWLYTWPDPSGMRDEALARTWRTGQSSTWQVRIVTKNGLKVFCNQAVKQTTGIVCYTVDVTEAEKQGAQRAWLETIALANHLDGVPNA